MEIGMFLESLPRGFNSCARISILAHSLITVSKNMVKKVPDPQHMQTGLAP